MKRLGLGILCVLGALAFTSSCSHTPHVANPTHWGRHFTKIFGWNEGEFHQLHVDLDRIILGVESYEELEKTEYVYSE